MRVTRRILAYGLLAVLMAACADLSVENLNEPDRERALSTPGDVETLIAGSFYSWFKVDQFYTGPGMAMSVMADEATSSWGNSFMREGSIEPRTAIPNDPSHGYRAVFENPWFWSYSAIAAVRDGLIAIAGEDGELFTGDDMSGMDTYRAAAFAKFVQGLAHGYLGLIYDKAFIVDETTNLDSLKEVVPVELIDETAYGYDAVAAAAVGYLEKAIQIAESNTFSIPQSWVGEGDGLNNNVQLAQMAHSYAARILAYWPRLESERDQVDWDAVKSHAEEGITEEFWIQGDDCVKWCADYKWCLNQLGWARTDLRMLGPAGSTPESNQRWVDWENTDPWSRQPFDVETDDARMPILPAGLGSHDIADLGWECVVPLTAVTDPQTGDTLDWIRVVHSGADTLFPDTVAVYPDHLRTEMCGKYFEYRDPREPFRANRGTFHFSGYADYRHMEYVDQQLGPILMFSPVEVDLLLAEAYIRLGSPASAVPLINTTREAHGHLPAATLTGAPEVNGRCTPRMFNGNCADLEETFQYEKRVEIYVHGVGTAFFDDRRWGDLLPLTPLQWPIPAKELLTILQEVYTFGGCDDPATCGGAPAGPNWSVVGGGGLRPLNPGDVPSEADIAARVQLFERINRAGLETWRRRE